MCENASIKYCINVLPDARSCWRFLFFVIIIWITKWRWNVMEFMQCCVC